MSMILDFKMDAIFQTKHIYLNSPGIIQPMIWRKELMINTPSQSCGFIILLVMDII